MRGEYAPEIARQKNCAAHCESTRSCRPNFGCCSHRPRNSKRSPGRAVARQSYAITTVERFRPPSSGTLSKRATVYPFAERKTISASVPVIEAALPAVSSGGGGILGIGG